MGSPFYRYRPEVLAELRRLGVVPAGDTPPARVYDFLKALYTFEIREMKLRRREAGRLLGEQPLAEYRRALFELKRRYPLLALPPEAWLAGAPAAARRRR